LFRLFYGWGLNPGSVVLFMDKMKNTIAFPDSRLKIFGLINVKRRYAV